RSASAGWLTCAAFTAFPLETSVAGQDQLDAYLPISHPERAHAALHVGGVLGVEVRSDRDPRNRDRERFPPVGQLHPEAAGDHVRDLTAGIGHLPVDLLARDAEHRR